MNKLKHIGVASITVPGALLCIDSIVEESYNHFGKASKIHPHITFTQPPLTADKLRVFIRELLDLGCDAFIAGCTEIPVVITDEDDSPLPFVDTTRLLAKKAFEYAATIS